ncbi:MAG: ADP-dependent glucokinase/phosphofructokinase [Geminicoccaceae bacterium]
MSQRWRDIVAHEFHDLAVRLPAMAAAAPVTLCGMSACVDARVDMRRAEPLFSAAHPEEAADFAGLLLDRATRGVGGEVRVVWTDGPRWLTERLDISYALGGVGPQAGWVLSTLGAPALVCLEDRSAHMLAQLPPGLLVAEGGEAVPAGELKPAREPRPDIFIFEYTAGAPAGAVIPQRSSRIIVRFNDPGLEHDAEFEQLSCRLAAEAGAGLVAGFNCVPREELEAEIERVFGLTRRWRAAGLATIHLEMSGFAEPTARDRVLEAARGAVTSVGMSQSEFLELGLAGGGEDELTAAMTTLAGRLELDRLCVHADQWAVTATRGDPHREYQALMAGCLLASARAAAGRPVIPRGVPEGALLDPPPFAPRTSLGAWTIVACPAPYLQRPATTLGLGDTFTAGCLLVLGSTSPGQAAATPPSAAAEDDRAPLC